ncbi:MAG: hypothetical protein ACK515_03490 [bacterium]
MNRVSIVVVPALPARRSVPALLSWEFAPVSVSRPLAPLNVIELAEAPEAMNVAPAAMLIVSLPIARP